MAAALRIMVSGLLIAGASLAGTGSTWAQCSEVHGLSFPPVTQLMDLPEKVTCDPLNWQADSYPLNDRTVPILSSATTFLSFATPSN